MNAGKRCNKLKLGLIILLGAFMTACGKNTSDQLVLPIIEPISEADVQTTAVEESDVYDISDIESDDNDRQEADATNHDSVSVIMVGDMLLHDRIEDVSKNEDGTYDYSAIFANTRDLIEEADIAIANEEVIIGGAELSVSGYPAFNAPYEFADALVATGFDVICQGTNHALDKGGKGITNCLNNWEEKYPDIGVLGIHDSAEDQNEIYTCEKNGITVAILNYTYGTNGIALPADMPYGVDYLSEDKVITDLKKAEEIADFTIVCPHWGTEYSLSTDASQSKWAQIFVENGADLIIGTHPHVIEKVEWISHEATGNKALCYYSLGNYVNWTSGTGTGVSNRMVGAMASVKLSRDISGNVIISEYEVIPLVSHVTSKEDGVTVYKLSDYDEELASQNEIIYQAPDFSYAYCNNLVSEIFGENE